MVQSGATPRGACLFSQHARLSVTLIHNVSPGSAWSLENLGSGQ